MNPTPAWHTVRIVHFTGTGSTTLVAKNLARAFATHGLWTEEQVLRHGVPDLAGLPDLLVIVYAVHGCNAPHPVYEWISRLPSGLRSDGQPTPVVVVANSGGGEVWPNKACRVGTISRLRKKGYRTIYEDMVVLPSNWIVATPAPLARLLLDILPQRIDRLVNEVLSGQEKHSRPGPIDRLTAGLGEAEKIGAREFGKRIQVSGDCTGCGLCVRACPAGNIGMSGEKPVFGKDCLLCLKCLYACPPQALSPGIARFIMVPEGYSLSRIEAVPAPDDPVAVEELARGWVWAGVRKYLQD